MANKNPIKQVSLPGSNVTYDIQDNTLVQGTGISITTSSTEGSKGQRTIAVITGTTSSTVAAGNHTHTISMSQTGTSTIDLEHDTVYTLTAGGQSISFKTPANSGSSSKYYHHSIFMSGANFGVIIMDWYTTRSTPYTDAYACLNALFTEVKRKSSTDNYLSNCHSQYINVRGFINSNTTSTGISRIIPVYNIQGRTDSSGEEDINYLIFLGHYYVSGNFNVKEIEVDLDDTSSYMGKIRKFSDVIID